VGTARAVPLPSDSDRAPPDGTGKASATGWEETAHRVRMSVSQWGSRLRQFRTAAGIVPGFPELGLQRLGTRLPHKRNSSGIERRACLAALERSALKDWKGS